MRADEVFVLAPPISDDCSPEAISKGRTSRRVEVPRGYVWLVKAFSDSYIAVRGPLTDWLADRRDTAPGEGQSFAELWTWVIEGSQSFVSRHAAPPDVLEKIVAVIEFAEDPRGAWQARQTDGHIDVSREVDVLIAFGLQFALAHEIGHHLLNHLEPQADVADLDVQGAIERWSSGLGVKPPQGLNRNQLREWCADAFAVMVLSQDLHDASETDDEFWRLAMLAAGSAAALLALHVGGESLSTTHGRTSSTHPPVGERLNLLVLALTVIGRSLPEPQALRERDDVDAEAGVAALQVFGCAVVIMELLERNRQGILDQVE